ncbi:ATP-dependent Clp protease adapter protein ClpS [bacterium HR29]|jgi:ATP-dependent Clp protease adaptor protein ClpS|nr:ATP-dependent Clp protease adapter protein ClpS [bacterium HR29]
MATETVIRPEIEQQESTGESREPLFHLILLDDDEHTYQYVVVMLNRIFGYSPEKGFAIACMVDSQGQAIVMTGPKEQVLEKQRAIHSFGADPWMPTSKGSMTAIIEPAG